MNTDFDYKKALAFVFETLYRHINRLQDTAKQNIEKFSDDTMKAFYSGETLGYERAIKIIDDEKAYIEAVEPKDEVTG